MIFDRFITQCLQKRIAVFKRQSDGSYTHTTYTSFINMPEEERLEYLLNCGCEEAANSIIASRRDYVKRVAAQERQIKR